MSIDAPNALTCHPEPAAGRQWFIYYRIHLDDLPRAWAAVRGFQGELQAALPGLTARLLRRPLATDGLVTLMETYAFDRPAAAPADALEQIERQALVLAPWLQGARHVEEFVACVC